MAEKKTESMSVKTANEKASTYELLSQVDVSSFIERKKSGKDGKELVYLGWASMFNEVQHFDPGWSRRVIEFTPDGIEVKEGERGLPYRTLGGGDFGYIVETEVTIKGETKRMLLPVMNYNNYAVKKYAYYVLNSCGYKDIVMPFNSMDFNTAVQRCYVKNIAINFGLGWSVYAGETFDDPQSDGSELPPENSGDSIHVEGDVALQPPEITMSLDQAKDHLFKTGGSSIQGKSPFEMILWSIDQDQQTKTLNILKKFAEMGTGDDKQACIVLLQALENRVIAFPRNNVEDMAA